jgi:hypothetical protein
MGALIPELERRHSVDLEFSSGREVFLSRAWSGVGCYEENGMWEEEGRTLRRGTDLVVRLTSSLNLGSCSVPWLRDESWRCGAALTCWCGS